ncbi:Nucleoredoxin-like protein 2 [Podila epigama]|nr:Nucleoredoxin-like protein 2 [Podila epigama]
MSSEPLLSHHDSSATTTAAAVGPEQPKRSVARATLNKSESILFRIQLEDANRKHVPVYEVADKIVGFFCSAGRFAACQELSVLVDRFLEANPNFVIIYLSLDLSEACFNRTMKAHPKWLAVPYNDPVRKDILTEWQQRGVPCLHIYSPVEHEILTSWGGSCLRFNSENCFEEWKAGRSGVSYFQILKGWWYYTLPPGEFKDMTEEELAQYGFPGSDSASEDHEGGAHHNSTASRTAAPVQDQRLESKKNK